MQVREVAVTGANGRALTVLVHRRSISTSTLYARQRFPDRPTFTVKETGQEVKYVQPGVYEVVATGERLTTET